MKGKTKQQYNVGVKIIKSVKQGIEKALTPTNVKTEEASNASDWIVPEMDMKGLRTMVNQSTILPQCIKAYRNNIPGYGIGIRYKEDTEETPEMAEEFQKAEKIIDLFNLDMDTKEVFEDLIEAREIYGIAYLEVIRNVGGEICQIEFVRDVPSITKTVPLEPYQTVEYFYNGETVERQKKFVKYRQQSGGKTVYFKEFGDKRIMDKTTGEYTDEGIDIDLQANEILEFAIGTEPYGEVRWLGQVLSADGMRKSEVLNHNYFVNGRHTPLMIAVRGGTLTDESFQKLQMYMEDIKGVEGQHAFIILETEAADNNFNFEGTSQPQIEIVPLAQILQQDELFQGYLDNGRKKIQSSFLLPDLYVGYTTDFNRATAQTAMEVTEKQVFQPERKSIAWVINNKLLNEFGFKYIEAYFLEPDINNPDDLVKILNICNNAGGLSPNKAKEIIYKSLGEVSEDYEGDWGNIPLAITNAQNSGVMMSLDRQIRKATAHNDTEIVAVMKEVRNLLIKNSAMRLTPDVNSGMIEKEWDESLHPRDEHGRFTSGGGESTGREYGETDTSDAVAEIKSGKANSLSNYLDEDGNLTPERDELHKQIIDNLLAGKVPVQGQATMTMLGGGPASGKSSVMNPDTSDDANAVTVDPDAIKGMLPGYAEMSRETDEAAGYYHEESSALAKRFAEVAFRENYNVVYDGTGDGSVASVEKKINGARSHGYEVNAKYVTIDTEEAVRRNRARYENAKAKGENPRLPNEELVRDCHAKVSRISIAVASQFDSIEVWDNNGAKGSQRLIATGGNGKGLTPVEGQEEAFKAYVNKGNK